MFGLLALLIGIAYLAWGEYDDWREKNKDSNE